MKATGGAGGTSKIYFRIIVWLGRSFHDCRSYRKPFDAENFLPLLHAAVIDFCRTHFLRARPNCAPLSFPHSLSEKSNIWCTKGVGADESRVVRVWIFFSSLTFAILTAISMDDIIHLPDKMFCNKRRKSACTSY